MQDWIKKVAIAIQDEVIACARRGNIVGWTTIAQLIEQSVADEIAELERMQCPTLIKYGRTCEPG